MAIINDFSFLNFLIAFLIAWGVSISIKIIIEIIKNKKFELYYIITDGGFPSCHSTFVSSLVAGTFLYSGFSLVTFVVLGFAIINIRDALGVRREVGKHSIILRVLKGKKFDNIKLRREGHTFWQVIAGIVIGILITTIVLLIL